MGPKPGTQRGRGNTSTDKKPTASDNTTDSSISRQWTGRPYDKPAWFLLNRRDLFDAVIGARQFIRYGISVDKKVSVMNLRHAQAYLNETIIEGTLAEPFSIDKLPALQAVAQQTAPVTTTTAAPAQPATVNTAGTAPATPPATPGATPTAAPAAAVAPVAPVAQVMVMPETLKDLGPGYERLQIAPELFDNMNEAVIRHFTDAIVDVRTRQTLVAQYNHSGLAFMVAMNKEITSTDISKNAAASARAGEMRNHRQAGISDTTTQSLNDFFNKDADLNDTLDGTPKHEDDDSLYVAYEDVLEEHSPDNHARITVEMNRIRTQAMLDKTTITNLEALKQAAHIVFAKVETTALRRAIEGGSAFAMQDARRDPEKKDKAAGKAKSRNGKKGGKGGDRKSNDSVYVTPLVWSAGMRTCLHCRGAPIDGGKHMDKDCPSRKAATAALTAGGDGSESESAMAKLFSGDGTSHDVSLDAFGQSPAELLACIAEEGAGRIAMAQRDDHTDDIADEDDGEDSDVLCTEIKEEPEPEEYEPRRIYVLRKPDETGGICYGKLNAEIIPHLRRVLTRASRAELIKLLLAVPTVDDAVDACEEHDVPTIFHGPAVLPNTQPGDLLIRSTDTGSSATDSISIVSSVTSAATDAVTADSLLVRREPERLLAGLVFVSSFTGLEGIWYCDLSAEVSNVSDLPRRSLMEGVLPAMRRELLLRRRNLVGGMPGPDYKSPSNNELVDKISTVDITLNSEMINRSTTESMKRLYIIGACSALQQMNVAQLRFRGPSVLVIGGNASETFGPGTLLTPFSDTQVRSLLQGVTLAPIPETWLRTFGITEFLSEQAGQTLQQSLQFIRGADGHQHVAISPEIMSSLSAELATLREQIADAKRNPDILTEEDRLRNEASMNNDIASTQQAAARWAEDRRPLTDAETAAAAKARRDFSEKPNCPASISLERLDAAAEATAYLKRSKAYAVHPPSHCVAAYDALRHAIEQGNLSDDTTERDNEFQVIANRAVVGAQLQEAATPLERPANSASLQAQEILRLERQRENERFAEERLARDRRERMQYYTKFTGFAALQLILITTCFSAHKYFTNAGAALPLVCPIAVAIPFITSFFAFLVTIAALSLRQAKSLLSWRPSRSHDRARRKTNPSIYQLAVDDGPMWVKVAYLIFKFFQLVPATCAVMIGTSLLGTVGSIGRGAIRGHRRTRSYLLGRVPASILRASIDDGRQIILLVFELYEVLNLNWPLLFALRLAAGARRLRHFCWRSILIGLVITSQLHETTSINVPEITWHATTITALRLATGVGRLPRHVRRLAYLLLTDAAWCHGAELGDVPSITLHLASIITRRSTPMTDVTADVTTTEIASPTQTDYHYVGTERRLLHLWDASKLAYKPHAHRQSVYATAALGERARAESVVSPTRAPGRRGRALLGAKPGTKRAAPPTSSNGALAWIHSVIDSGCSWHVHYRKEDMVNIRPSSDTFKGIDHKLHRAVGIGDMPVVVKTSRGKHIKVLIRNVRIVPSLSDTLFSVDQFWEDSKVDTVFRDVRCVVLPRTESNPSVSLPFSRRGKLFQWAVLPIASTSRSAHGLGGLPDETTRSLKAATIHSPASSSHVATLPPDQMIDVLHRRLHIGFDTLRRLGTLAADIPENIRSGKTESCPHCKTANASHLAHNGNAYKPSYPGRLVHADIAGPFRRSVHGQHQYFLILIDDHTRWKEVYFLRTKDEALAKIRSFVAKFKSIANQGRDEPTRIVGTLHTDNAGEFLSRQFEELLADETMEHTRCPAHVHQLNGVAERSIRSVLEIVRANIEASGAPIGFWPYIVEHAVDCLNRTTGPPDAGKTAYEMLTGDKPKVMTILPFGCRAYAVKPRAAFLKSNFASRAWTGLNLGRARHTPGAYNIWLPAEGKVVCTSEVYFDEGVMPWRPKGDQRIGNSMPTPPPTSSAVDSLNESNPSPPVADAEMPPAISAAEAYDRATRGETAVARRSRTVLLLFCGPYRRPDGLAAFLTKYGFDVEMLDNDPVTGGGSEGDILNDDVHNRLLQRASRGEFLTIIAAPPCSTFSISRHFEGKGSTSSDGGPPLVRTRTHIRGLPSVPPKHRRELSQANAIVARLAAILMAAFTAGTQFIVENPADRGDSAFPRRYLDAEHGPLWEMPEIQALRKLSSKLATFPMCAFNAPWQKYTSLLYSSGYDEWLDPLDRLECNHSSHSQLAGGIVGPDAIPSSETSAYPTDFNHYLARAVRSLVVPTRASKDMVEADARTHAPDGGITKDPAYKPPLLPALAPAAAPVSRPDATNDDPVEVAGDDVGPDEISDLASERVDRGTPATPTPPTTELAPTRAARARRSPFIRGAGPQMTRHSRRQLGEGLAPGLNDTKDWTSASLNALRQTAGRLAFTMTGGSGFAALRDLDDPPSDVNDRDDSESDGYIALAKPSATDPKTQLEAYAMDREGWRASEQKEIDNHRDNGSWELIERSSVPRGRQLIKLVWVYKTKRDGSLKSRLCVQGCRQVKGVDYNQTWCGTMRGASLRLLSSIAAKTGMRMRRWDFVAAYLQGELLEGEVVYCLPPSGGYSTTGKDGLPMVCKIVKPVYGMAQAGRRWQRSLYPWLKEYGFTQISPDSSVFTLEREMDSPTGKHKETIHLGAYVDDLCVIYGNDDKYSLYLDFITKLQERWKVEDEGDLHDLLGIEFKFIGDTVTLHQQTYIEKLSTDFLPDGVPPQFQANKPPCDHNLPLHVVEAMSQESATDIDAEFLRRYQSLVGALLYCSGNTRPDVAFAVGMLCRAMSKPTHDLYQDGLRVLSYLHRTRHIGLRYQADAKHLHGQSDSDWGVRHSTSGWQFTYSMAVISWGSKKQISVALSSCEAEIMAASEAAKEALFLSRFLDELGHGSSEPIEMGMDNQAAIAISYNPELHARTKHIDRRHFFVRECVENMQLRVPYVNTVDNLADFFTKPLAKNDYFRMRDILMNVPPADRIAVSRERKTLVRGGE